MLRLYLEEQYPYWLESIKGSLLNLHMLTYKSFRIKPACYHQINLSCTGLIFLDNGEVDIHSIGSSLIVREKPIFTGYIDELIEEIELLRLLEWS